MRSFAGEEGWVWVRNVKTVGSENAAGKDPFDHIDPSWTKVNPTRTTFTGAEGPCPADGDKSDPAEFVLKNRADVPDSYHEVKWTAIDELPYPGKDKKKERAKNLRKKWTADQLDVIKPFELIPVSATGYIAAIKPQSGGKGEGTNCHQNRPGDVDAHLAFVNSRKDAESKAIVIEWTPRFLKDHPNWTKTKLRPWMDSHGLVRISGWLMVDPDHYGHLGKYRNTIWEIHPITNIEVMKDGKFVSLDDLP